MNSENCEVKRQQGRFNVNHNVTVRWNAVEHDIRKRLETGDGNTLDASCLSTLSNNLKEIISSI